MNDPLICDHTISSNKIFSTSTKSLTYFLKVLKVEFLMDFNGS